MTITKQQVNEWRALAHQLTENPNCDGTEFVAATHALAKAFADELVRISDLAVLAPAAMLEEIRKEQK